jgi:3-oxoacyl-[acyl-carrier protein] reductase
MITGASGGIGAACARAFAAEGARLVLHANRNLEAARTLAGELGDEALAVRADLTSESEVERLFAESLARFDNRLDVLIANAGVFVSEDVPIHRMTLDQWNSTLAADQTSVFLCAREFFRHLKKRKPETASLVIIGSTAAVFGEEGHADYSAAKAAIAYGLVRSLKNEIVRLAPRGRVNAICPGWVATPMVRRAMENKEVVKRVLQTRAIKRVGRPEEIATAAVFLASDAMSSHVSGQALTVAGGMEGRLLHRVDDVDPDLA